MAAHDWQLASGVERQTIACPVMSPSRSTIKGHAHHLLHGIRQVGTFNYWGHNFVAQWVFVRRSLDGGKTWETNHIPIIEHPTEPGISVGGQTYIISDTSQAPTRAIFMWVGRGGHYGFRDPTPRALTRRRGRPGPSPIELTDHPGCARSE